MAKVDFKNIDEIAKSLCTGCGTCVGICPEKAVAMMLDREEGIYLPQVDRHKCSLCHLCVQACPGIAVDFDNLNARIFGRIPHNIFLGNFLKCYVGYAVDHSMRYNSSSGGLVSALLDFGLKRGVFDGALVTKMDPGNTFSPGPFLARDPHSIMEATTSKYLPVAANTALKELLKENGKFAIVGLPCHIEGIRKAQVLMPRLRQRAQLLLGLFCGRSQTLYMTETLTHRLNIDPQDVVSLRYRGKGWPGKIEIVLRSGESKILDFLTYYDALGCGWFYPLRCMTCPDATNELADLSFGDAWKFGEDDKIGLSLLIVRTHTGSKLIHEAALANVIQLSEVHPRTVICNAKGMLNSKKKQLIPCLTMNRLFGQRTPGFVTKLPKNKGLDYVIAFLRYVQVFLPQHYKRVITLYAPLSLLRVHQKVLAGLFRL